MPPGGTDSRYGLILISGQTAGLVTAAGAATLGARVAPIEREAGIWLRRLVRCWL